ncbi:hypothetical protein FAA86_04240 [Rhizobium rosettiformans W3]|nr:hypothetical protein FAA86_04240 [Rhizobium rosettiformans W3]
MRPGKKQPLAAPVEPVTTLASVPKVKPDIRPLKADLAGLNSLNRNYHAYLNSADPRMSAIRDYAVTYATYELASGIDTLPTDVTLGDEALRAALEAAAKPGAVIDDDTLAWAKDVLGVGPAVGKIDEIREDLAAAEPVEPPLDPITDPVTDTVTDPVVDPGTDVVEEPVPVGEPVDEAALLPSASAVTPSETQ